MTQPNPADKRVSVKEKLRLLFEEFGTVAVGVYFAIWLITLGSIWTAMKMGWQPESAAGQAGTFGAAYVVFRLTLPPRIAATVVLTPIVARVLERLGLKQRRM